jgi:hypothetical protein
VGVGESIPHITDLLRVTRVLESTYTEQNARSVWLDMTVNGETRSVRYHFSKVRT